MEKPEEIEIETIEPQEEVPKKRGRPKGKVHQDISKLIAKDIEQEIARKRAGIKPSTQEKFYTKSHKNELKDEVLTLRAKIKASEIPVKIEPPCRINSMSLDRLRITRDRFNRILNDGHLIEKEKTKIKRKQVNEQLQKGLDEEEIHQRLSEPPPEIPITDEQIMEKVSMVTMNTIIFAKALEKAWELPRTFLPPALADGLNIEGYGDHVYKERNQLAFCYREMYKNENYAVVLDKFRHPLISIGTILGGGLMETMKKNSKKKLEENHSVE